MIVCVLEKVELLKCQNLNIFCLVPGHVGVVGNEKAQGAKKAFKVDFRSSSCYYSVSVNSDKMNEMKVLTKKLQVGLFLSKMLFSEDLK